MNYLLIAIAVLLFVVQRLCFKLYNQHFMKNFSKYYFYSFMYSILSAIIFSFSSTEIAMLDKYTIIFAIPFGVFFIFTVYFYAKAMETGPLSYSALMFSLSLLLPIIFGISAMGEKLSIFHLIGLLMLMITFYLASTGNKSGQKTISLKWFFYAVLSMIGNGFLGVFQKAHQMFIPGEQVSEFLMLAFTVSAVISLVLYMVNTKSFKLPFVDLKQKNFIWILLGTAVSTSFGNQIILYLNGKIDAVIIYPAVSGSVLIFMGIASFLIFKEKLTKRSLIGFIIGVIAIFVINVG